MTKTTDKSTELKSTANGIFAKIMAVAVFLLLAVFPIYVEDRYANILRAKYRFYYVIVLAALAAILVVTIVFAFIDKMENGGAGIKEFMKKFAPSNWKKTFAVHDVALILFMIAVIISAFQSEYLYESVWGNEGRFSGMFLLLVYSVSVFLIGRLFQFKNWYLEAFLISSMLVCLFGITDYFRLDVMGFKLGLAASASDIFTSTFGNINTYTAFIALVMGVAAVLYVSAQKKIQIVWYYICMTIAFTAAITGQSDNTYLSLAVLFGFLPFYCFRKRSGIRRYAVMLATLFTVIRVLAVFDITMKGDEWGQVIGLEGLARVIGHFKGTTFLVVGLWLIVAILCFFDYRKYREKTSVSGKAGHQGNSQDEIGKLPVIIWGAFVILVVAAVAAVVYDANFAGHAERYGALSNYVVFNDEWGTNRGFAWRFAMELYDRFPIHHKLFGYGPDTFGILTTNYTGATATKMYEAIGQIYDSVHNAYLQYFVTIGPVGTIPYITFLITSVACMIKKAGKSPAVMACVFAVACYSGQAVVNIDLPAVTPAFWTLLAVGLAAARACLKREKVQN